MRSLSSLPGLTRQSMLPDSGIKRSAAPLLWLHVRRAYYLAPLLGFRRQQLAEIAGRTRERDIAEIGQPRVDLRIGEARPDLPVQHLDDIGGRAAWRADAGPAACFIPRQ